MGDVLFDKDSYTIRKKLFNFLGQKFYVYDDAWDLVGYVKQKAFKLKEDIRVFKDTTCQDEILTIKARNIIDFSAAYDVTDATTGESVGALRRKGMMSTFVMDTWEILDKDENVIGQLSEDSPILAVIRRYMFKLIPQGFTFNLGRDPGATFQQNWNFFVPKLKVNFHAPAEQIDRRLGLGAAVLMCAIEGRNK